MQQSKFGNHKKSSLIVDASKDALQEVSKVSAGIIKHS